MPVLYTLAVFAVGLLIVAATALRGRLRRHRLHPVDTAPPTPEETRRRVFAEALFGSPPPAGLNAAPPTTHDEGKPMPRFQVELMHSISTTVTVDTATGAAAVEMVSRCDYPLPPRHEWSGHKDWRITAYDDDGREVASVEG